MALRRVSKAEWLATALIELEEGGIAAVRIDRLAKKLGISRSGFYWHFTNRKDLYQAILEYWQFEFTDVVIKRISSEKGSPRDRLTSASEMIVKFNLARYDLAIREWAKHDPLALAAVKRVDKARYNYIRSLFAEMGFTGDDLEIRTSLFVCYHTWERNTFFDLPKSKIAKLRSMRLSFLMSM